MMCARKLGKLKDTKRKSIYALLIIERPSIVLTMPNWDVLEEWESHHIVLNRKLYVGHQVTIQTVHGNTDSV